MMGLSDNVLVKTVSGFLVELPTPLGISYMWNFGSMLAFCLGVQLVTGIFLAMNYTANVDLAFFSLIHINRDVNFGWLMHYVHANGASFFFICIYFHIGRGFYYGSYSYVHVWLSGVVILLVLMMVAFLGYVLPWGQMSFWGATVITNLVSAVPYWGVMIVEWLWGGYSVGNPTLVRFYAFHYLFPFVLIGLVLVHLVYLHETGSSMPLGLNSDYLSGEFHPYFGLKDLFGLMVLFTLMMILVFFSPNFFGDSENFILANPMVTPVHIQPEWYFLFAYAILRSIPNKLGGVVALVASVVVLMFCVMYGGDVSGMSMSMVLSGLFWVFVVIFFLLSWIGARPVEYPYVLLGQIFTFFYFSVYLVIGVMSKLNI